MITKAFFDEKTDRRHTDSVKWDSPEVCPEGSVPLWVADMDFRSPPAVEEALKKRAAHPVYGYTRMTEEAAEAFCAFWSRRHGVSFLPKETLMIPCVVTGLKLCVRAFSRPGEEVCVMDPVYGPFYDAVRVNDRKIRPCTLLRDPENRYHMDFEGIERALSEGVRLILFCNPHNPVSRLWSREELTRLVRLAGRYGAVLVSDEIHADFVYSPGTFTSMLSIPGAEETVVALMSASKTFNIAGLQQAEMVTHRGDYLERCRRECEACGVLAGNLFAMTATEAAYREGDAWLDALLEYLDVSRRTVERTLRTGLPFVRLTPIEATYLAWVDFGEYAADQKTLEDKLRRAKVSLTLGTFFGSSCEGFARINFGCPSGQLEEGLDRIVRALNE